ncbi:hypothetical protein ABZP36_005700 [Zizania latifolia]
MHRPTAAPLGSSDARYRARQRGACPGPQSTTPSSSPACMHARPVPAAPPERPGPSHPLPACVVSAACLSWSGGRLSRPRCRPASPVVPSSSSPATPRARPYKPWPGRGRSRSARPGLANYCLQEGERARPASSRSLFPCAEWDEYEMDVEDIAFVPEKERRVAKEWDEHEMDVEDIAFVPEKERRVAKV